MNPAVPGMPAKPIVDILVEVTDLRAVRERIVPLLEAQGYEVSPVGVARWYQQRHGALLDGLILDHADAALAPAVAALGARPLVTQTIMRDHADRERLAREALSFAAALASAR